MLVQRIHRVARCSCLATVETLDDDVFRGEEAGAVEVKAAGARRRRWQIVRFCAVLLSRLSSVSLALCRPVDATMSGSRGVVGAGLGDVGDLHVKMRAESQRADHAPHAQLLSTPCTLRRGLARIFVKTQFSNIRTLHFTRTYIAWTSTPYHIRLYGRLSCNRHCLAAMASKEGLDQADGSQTLISTYLCGKSAFRTINITSLKAWISERGHCTA